MKKHILALILLSIFFSGIFVHEVLSRTYLDPDIERRIENQHNRIEDGVRSGELNIDEVRLLKNNLNYIQDEAKRFQTDGSLSENEKEWLMRMLYENSNMIQDKKQNPVRNLAVSESSRRDHEIRDRIAEQQRRINRGVESGNLTVNEAKVLDGNLNHILEQETRFMGDGTLDGWEKGRLLRMLDNNAAMIQDKKNNPIIGYSLGIELDDRGNSIPQRIANQQYRINEGVRTGVLTRGEATTLEENLEFIRREEIRQRSSGGLNDRERERLHILLDQNGAMISDKKHNPIRRYR
jgi:hypothetical protein